LITLALDTCDSRGGIALRREGKPWAGARHDSAVDFSEWVLPAVAKVIALAGCRMEDVDLLAVATGPGSFTGLRVGLTTVKAWSEVYRKQLVGVSRLEAMACGARTPGRYRAVFYNAHRGQIFGALYRSEGEEWTGIEGEKVVAPEEFLDFVVAMSEDQPVSWISLDPELLRSVPGWRLREQRGEAILGTSSSLADQIGALAELRAKAGRYASALELDANYVRRSDAEIHWKGGTRLDC